MHAHWKLLPMQWRVCQAGKWRCDAATGIHQKREKKRWSHLLWCEQTQEKGREKKQQKKGVCVDASAQVLMTVSA